MISHSLRKQLFSASLLLLLFLVGPGASPANADTITVFTDRPTFDAAVGSTTVETFTSSFHFPITTGTLSSTTSLVVANGTPINPGDIQAGVTYSTPIGTGNFFNIDTGGNFIGGFLDGLDPADSPAVTATFTSPVKEVGFDTDSLIAGNTVTVEINFTTGPSFSDTLSISGLSFLGFEATGADIQSIGISDSSTQFAFAVDNFTFGGAGAVTSTPEPGSVLLLFTVVATVAVLLRRRQTTGG